MEVPRRDRSQPLNGEHRRVRLIQRAIDAGALREDVGVQDMPLIQLMVGSVIDVAHDIAPELWRRYLPSILRGLRARPADPEPLPVGPIRSSGWTR